MRCTTIAHNKKRSLVDVFPPLPLPPRDPSLGYGELLSLPPAGGPLALAPFLRLPHGVVPGGNGVSLNTDGKGFCRISSNFVDGFCSLSSVKCTA